MEVIVKDDRVFPEYKNVQIVALFREMLNDNGLNWDACVAAGEAFQEALEDADYVCDDIGRTWARSFTPPRAPDNREQWSNIRQSTHPRENE